jgi:chitodextrinase
VQANGVVDATPPTAPTGITVSGIKSSRFNLTWTASTDNLGVVSYEIFNGSTSLGTSTTTSFLVNGLSPATAYSISIKAKDAANNLSAASASYPVTTAAFDATIPHTWIAPVIDGTKEASWTGTTYSIDNLTAGAVSGSSDLSGNWTASWDDANLYLFVNITDDAIRVDGPNWYDDDRIEIFIDAEGNRGGTYGTKDYQYFIRPGETTISETKLNAITNVQLANITVTGGYRLELKIPFSTLGITPVSLNKLGIDVQLGDDDDGGSADGKLAWYSLDDNSWASPSLFGVASLGQKSDVIAPSVATALVTTAITATSFTLAWTASTDNVGVTGYEVFKAGVSVGTTASTSLNVTGLTASTTYSMTVKARDAAGNWSAASPALDVTTIDIQAPTVPSALATTAISTLSFP